MSLVGFLFLSQGIVLESEQMLILSFSPTVVPGIFFDLNPAKRRDLFDSPCHHFIRLSYGPRMEVLRMGLDGIERIIKKSNFPRILSSR